MQPCNLKRRHVDGRCTHAVTRNAQEPWPFRPAMTQNPRVRRPIRFVVQPARSTTFVCVRLIAALEAHMFEVETERSRPSYLWSVENGRILMIPQRSIDPTALREHLDGRGHLLADTRPLVLRSQPHQHAAETATGFVCKDFCD